MNTLFLIPARAGSKGLPGKNIKLLNNKPLFLYSVDFVREIISEGDEICVSTNDDELIEIAEKSGVKIHFKRPENLSTDTASSQEVIIHALDYFENLNKHFDSVLLLQPTSPFRIKEDFEKMKNKYSSECDMLVSVKESKENPYFTLFEENENGFLSKSKESDFTRRQDCPNVYAFNGSMYLINTISLRNMPISNFKKIKKIIMPEKRSVDIDTLADWALAEFYLNNI